MFQIVSILLCVLATVLLFLWQRRKYKLQYWTRRGVPTDPPHIIFGTFAASIYGEKSSVSVLQQLYDKYKACGERYYGMYIGTIPIFVPIDIELLKNIFIKEFNSFMDRGVSVNIDKEPLNGHMFFIKGEAWQERRQKFSPLFTTGRMRSIFGLIESNTDVLCSVLKDNMEQEVTFKPYVIRLGVDIIANTAFGLECHTLRNENPEFYEMVTRIFMPKPWDAIKLFFTDMHSPSDILRLTSSDKEMVEYFSKIIRDTVQYRKKNNIRGNDLLQAMIEVVNEDDADYIQHIQSEAFLFFIAAMETFAISTTYTIYELANNERLQTELREEIEKNLALQEGRFDYDLIMNNKLLDRIVKESLRKHPPGIFTFRECAKDYRIPNSNVTIEKGTFLMLPIYPIHHDAEHYPNPQEFDPDRFMENPPSCTFIPFGEGPRYCIGKILGMMQLKLVIAKLINRFEFKLGASTLGKPLITSPYSTSMVLLYEEQATFNIKEICK